CCFFFSRPRLPPEAARFPYTTLFRSRLQARRFQQRLGLGRIDDLVGALVGVVDDLVGLGAGRLQLSGDLLLGLREVLLRMVGGRSEEHTSELQSRENLVCRLLLEKKN